MPYTVKMCIRKQLLLATAVMVFLAGAPHTMQAAQMLLSFQKRL
jgi:hypothetical protein